MFSIDQEQAAAERSHVKVLELARTCGWLRHVLGRQEDILAQVAMLDRSQDATSWAHHWALLDGGVGGLFDLEEIVLAPAIVALGLRAHAVTAQMCRRHIVREVEDLRWPSWQDGSERVRHLAGLLADHFAREQANSYRALARQEAHANAALTLRCEDMSGEPADAGSGATA